MNFSTRKLTVCLAILFAAFVIAVAPAAAQVQNAVMTGTVTDPQGAAVPNAEVAITNLGTNSTTTIKSNAEGMYRASELPVGSYKITVSATGFKTQIKSGLYLGAGVIERVDMRLEVGAQTETVTVEATTVAVQTDDSRLYQTIGASQVANLPLNGRNVFDLMTLAPGAVDATGVSFENGHGTVVNGLRPNFNGFLINGSSDKGLSGGVVTTPNADMVQEFQELTLNMSAQYGNSAAAIVNVVTKSGTNDFHGTVYEYLRNDKFDANDFFRNKGNTGTNDVTTNPALRPAKLRYNQFGLTAEGPILKDKLFFTASYQGERFVTAAPPVPILSESPEWRQLVASAYPNSVANTIYKNFPTTSPGTPDPNYTLANYVTGGNSGTGFSQFGDYMCPDNYPAGFVGLTGKFMNLFGVTAADQAYLTGTHPKSPTDPTPVPNCKTYYVGGAPALLNGIVTDRNMPFLNDNLVLFGSQTSGNLFNGNEFSGRIDWLRKNDRISGEYMWVHSSDSYGPENASSSIHGFQNPTANHNPNLHISWVHTFSPNWINEARAGYVLNRGDVSVATPGVPAIGFDDGSAGFGSYNGYPQYFHENIYSYGDMMSFQKKNHSIKVGVDLRRNLENSEFNVARPSYYFFDQFFFSMDAPYYMVGGVDPGFVGNQPAQLSDNYRHWRNLEMGAFIQDDWKVSRKLTLNLGLRYDLYTRHTEKMGKVTTFEPGPGCQFPANGYCADWILNANAPAGSANCSTPYQMSHSVLAGVCGPGGFAVTNSLGAGNHKNFGPRVGFAYDPFGNGKTAIRGGFGVSYEGTLYNPLSNSRWNPPFYSFNAVGNALGGDSNAVVYGPTATCDGVTVTPYCPAGTPAGVAACNPVTTVCLGSGATPTFSGAAANPGIGTGTQATGNIQGYNSWNANFANLTGIVFPAGLREPLILNYYFGIQREILPKTTLEINFVGTQGRHLFRAEQANRLPGNRLPAGTQVIDSFGRVLTGYGHRYLNPNYGRLRVWDNVSKSWYNSLQVNVKRQVSAGLSAVVNYTWSHSLDTGSDWHSGATSANGAAAGDGYSLDPTMPILDKGNSTFDIRHRLAISYVYEIPYGKEQKNLMQKVLGGWQYQGIWAFQSGAHFTPYCSSGNACDFNYDGERNDRPSVGPGGTTYSPTKDQWANGWFNVPGAGYTCAWANGGAGTTGTCADGSTPFFATPCKACDGNVGRNTFEGPKLFNTDESLIKNINMTERFKLQFRFEVFNAFNHVNFKLPSSATGANFANRITSGIFGESAGEMSPRLMQFALKLKF